MYQKRDYRATVKETGGNFAPTDYKLSLRETSGGHQGEINNSVDRLEKTSISRQLRDYTAGYSWRNGHGNCVRSDRDLRGARVSLIIAPAEMLGN